MNAILALIRKEYRLFWSDKVAVSLTFLIPIGLIAIWGSIFGNLGSGPTNLRLAFLNQSPAPIAKKIEHVLDTTRTFLLVRTYSDDNGKETLFDSSSIQDYVRRGSAAAALVIPPDAFSDTSFGMKLKFYYDPKNDMEMRVIQGVLTQTVISQVPGLFVKGIQQRAVKFLGFDSGAAFNRSIARTVNRYFNVDTNRILSSLSDTSFVFGSSSASGGNFFKNILDFQSEQLVGKDVSNPWATRSVGGWAIMFLMFTLTASAASLFEEKQSGVVLRILASPISRAHILWSKFIYNVSLGCIQLAVLFVFGAIMFKIDIVSHIVNLACIVLAAAMACTAFGMLLSAVSTTQAQARGLGTFLILAMSSIGGAWFPVSFMPSYIQAVSKVTIVYWSMDGFLKVLWRGAPFVDSLPNLGILLAIAGIVAVFSLWRFRRGHVF